MTPRDLPSTLAIFHQMSNVVSSMGDTEKVLAGLVELITRMLHVENCSIMLIDPSDQTLRIRAAHGLEPEIARNYRGKIGDGIAGWVAQHGQPLLIKDLEKHPLFKGKVRGRYSTRSLLSVPLLSDDKLIGVLNVNNKINEEVFDNADLLLMKTVSQFVSITLERAAMREIARQKEALERELQLARQIQESILPSCLNVCESIDVASCNLPARSVAGDFYDLIRMRDGSLCVVLGDVCGKGLPAALYMARVVSYFRAVARQQAPVNDLLSTVNELLANEFTDSTFATAAALTVDPANGRSRLSVAGHPPPLHRCHTSGKVVELTTEQGLPLGVDAVGAFDSIPFALAPGDTLLLYTDGATEVTNEKGDLFGSDRLQAIVAAHDGDAAGLVQRVIEAVQVYAADGSSLSDDLTLIAVRRKP